MDRKGSWKGIHWWTMSGPVVTQRLGWNILLVETRSKWAWLKVKPISVPRVVTGGTERFKFPVKDGISRWWFPLQLPCELCDLVLNIWKSVSYFCGRTPSLLHLVMYCYYTFGDKRCPLRKKGFLIFFEQMMMIPFLFTDDGNRCVSF